MPRFIKKSTHKPAGSPPGTLLYIGNHEHNITEVSAIEYSKKEYRESLPFKPLEIQMKESADATLWVHLQGYSNMKEVKAVQQMFNIPSIFLEDVLNSNHRPKAEEHDGLLFIILKRLVVQDENGVERLHSDHVGIVLGKGFVISFQEQHGGLAEPIWERICTNQGVIRKKKADFLLFAIIDHAVDQYLNIIENLGEQIEELDKEVLISYNPELLKTLSYLKSEMVFVKKMVLPLKEAIHHIIRSESPLLNKEDNIYFRDVYNHLLHIMENIETYQHMLSDALDIYWTMLNTKMNESMRVLTVFASIFVPLTLISAIYGMNFKYMPELEWEYGYIYVWILMIGAGFVSYFILKKKF